jgi:transposase
MSKPKAQSKRVASLASLPPLHLNAAGIDVGSEFHFVAVPPDRDAQPVRKFGSFTVDLQGLADWLKSCGIDTVVLESTGVYWVALFELLESHGFEVLLVDPRRLKSVPGRKTDVVDCQWLQQLHTYGLLSGAFRPTEQVCVLRSYVRQRAMLVQQAAQHIQHMQKALHQMNVKLDKVVSALAGVTGMAIVRAILKGERDPVVLAQLRDFRCHSSEEVFAKALQGNWRDEHLFALQQAVALYDVYQQQIAECDQRIEACLAAFEDKSGGQAPPRKPSAPRKKRRRNEPDFEMREPLQRMTGVDLTQIDGLEGHTVLKVVSEIGTDMSRWPTVKHFTSWLSLCPGSKRSGGKVLSSRTKPSANRAAAALRMAATGLQRSQSALGAFFRRMRARLGTPKAITATAHKLARLIYFTLKHGWDYVDKGAEWYERQFQERLVRSLSRKAADLGFKLVPVASPEGSS